MVVSVAVNVGMIFRRVWLREASASEPPMNCRKRFRRCQNRGVTLVWGLSSSFDPKGRSFFSFISFFVRSKSPFLPPDPGFTTSTRAEAVKVGRCTNLLACSAFARPRLDSFEHDGMLGAIGTIRGEPAFGRDQSRHNLVFGGCENPTMMQPCASAAKILLPFGIIRPPKVTA
jgi:hypothetical protein